MSKKEKIIEHYFDGKNWRKRSMKKIKEKSKKKKKDICPCCKRDLFISGHDRYCKEINY